MSRFNRHTDQFQGSGSYTNYRNTRGGNFDIGFAKGGNSRHDRSNWRQNRYNQDFQGRHSCNENQGRYCRTRGFYQHRNTPYNRTDNNRRYEEPEIELPVSPLEQKIKNLICALQSQHPLIGQIIFTKNDNENPTVLLQNGIQSLKNCSISVLQNAQTGLYELRINSDKFAEGSFPTPKIAKQKLFETVFNDFKDRCFLITKKKNYEEVKTGDANKEKKEETPPDNSSGIGESSKAYQIMLKMGWGGKGLGVKEQGEEKSVAEKITENITREGLGSKNVMEEVEKIMRNFAQSLKLSTLIFDSSFSKDERAQMHKIAQKYNLKSKSEGKDENRRLTISKKLDRWDIVRELLRSDLENESYCLQIPEKFKHLWVDDTYSSNGEY